MSIQPLFREDFSNSAAAFSGAVKFGRTKRISLQQFTVYLIFFDILALAGFAFLPAIVEKGVEAAPGDLFDGREFAVAITVVLFFVVARGVGAYDTRKILDLAHSTRRLAVALLTTFTVLIVLSVATKTSQQYSRLWFFSWATLACVLAPAHRVVAIDRIRKQLRQGDFVYRAVSAGLFQEPLGAREIAVHSRDMVQIHSMIRFDNYDEFDHLATRIVQDEIDQIYLVTPWAYAPHALEKLQSLRQLSAEIFVLPVDARVHAHSLGVGSLGDQVSLKSVDRPINGWDLWSKRAQDVVVSTALLTFFAPALAAIALAIKFDSPGPVLFRQKRAGFNGRHFELLKFRSMRADATDADAERQTGQSDPRVTRVGRFIRRTSLDELPQFINVLQGSMSVVGPRPHALKTRAGGRALEDVADQYAARHRVKPGITGWAQVKGYRGELDTAEKVKRRVQLDIEYIENWSMWLDLKIMLRTALLIFADGNAY